MKNEIASILEQSILSLKNAKSQLSNNKIKTITIDKTFFNREYCQNINITKCPIVNIGYLKNIKNPVLYWFSFKQVTNNNKLFRNAYIEFRKKMIENVGRDIYRNTASYKKAFSLTSNALYVGKVEKYFWVRVVTHLGYNSSEKTAGMQLFYWYDILKYGDIKLQYIEFNDDMKYLIPTLEKKLALELEPLIGTY